MFQKEDFLEGKLLLIDKPLEWTSFQAVNKIRWLIRQQFQLKKIKLDMREPSILWHQGCY